METPFDFVDTHAHFWDPVRMPYPWLAEVPSIAGLKIGSGFSSWLQTARGLVWRLSVDDQAAFFRDNARRIYRLAP